MVIFYLLARLLSRSKTHTPTHTHAHTHAHKLQKKNIGRPDERQTAPKRRHFVVVVVVVVVVVFVVAFCHQYINQRVVPEVAEHFRFLCRRAWLRLCRLWPFR